MCTHLNSHHHVEMTLRILFDDVAHIVRFSRLLEFSTCDKIFDFSYRTDGVAMGLSQSAKKDRRRMYLMRNEKSMLIDANLSMMSSGSYCVTRAGSTSSSGSCSASTSSLAASVTELVWLINGWRFTRPVDLVSIESTERQNEYIFWLKLIFPSLAFSRHYQFASTFIMWKFQHVGLKKKKREKQGNIDPAGKEGERKHDERETEESEPGINRSVHTQLTQDAMEGFHTSYMRRKSIVLLQRLNIAHSGLVEVEKCSAQSYAEIGSRWNRNYFFYSLPAHNMSGSQSAWNVYNKWHATDDVANSSVIDFTNSPPGSLVCALS